MRITHPFLDSYVDCSNRSLETHFEMEQWLMMNVTAKVISFEHNCMVHVTPFPQIVVERLILRKNRITRIDYRAFKELINLTELDLSYNQLTPQMLQPHVFEVIETILGELTGVTPIGRWSECGSPFMIHRSTRENLTFNFQTLDPFSFSHSHMSHTY